MVSLLDRKGGMGRKRELDSWKEGGIEADLVLSLSSFPFVRLYTGSPKVHASLKTVYHAAL